jgi:carbon-monoxide dehydrogenase small subunit
MAEPESAEIRCRINGRSVVLETDPLRAMVDVLRVDLGLTGTKEGCGVGVCGACSVLVDGSVVSSCLLPVGLVEGANVMTIEGIATPHALGPLQAAFVEHGAIQCGFCTPGQVMMAGALLSAIPDPSDADIDDWMSGSLCRCTGYVGIRRAIQAVSKGQDG